MYWIDLVAFEGIVLQQHPCCARCVVVLASCVLRLCVRAGHRQVPSLFPFFTIISSSLLFLFLFVLCSFLVMFCVLFLRLCIWAGIAGTSLPFLFSSPHTIVCIHIVFSISFITPPAADASCVLRFASLCLRRADISPFFPFLLHHPLSVNFLYASRLCSLFLSSSTWASLRAVRRFPPASCVCANTKHDKEVQSTIFSYFY